MVRQEGWVVPGRRNVTALMPNKGHFDAQSTITFLKQFVRSKSVFFIDVPLVLNPFVLTALISIFCSVFVSVSCFCFSKFSALLLLSLCII